MSIPRVVYPPPRGSVVDPIVSVMAVGFLIVGLMLIIIGSLLLPL